MPVGNCATPLPSMNAVMSRLMRVELAGRARWARISGNEGKIMSMATAAIA